MRILYIGSGFVGACSAAISGASGHDVMVYDIDENKIKMLGSNDRDVIESCLSEDGLGDLLVRNSDRIKFTTDKNKLEDFAKDCQVIFMCLPTPEIGETGESNLSYYFSAAENLSEILKNRNSGRQENYIVIVNKSTVPIDMVDKTKEIMDKAGVKNYGVVSNPEFLVEGKAIQGSMRPDRVVIGAWEQKDFEIMRQVYQRFYDAPTVQYIEVNPKEAAAGKLLANFYLFNKLAVCFDVIGRTCETFNGLRFESIRKILTTDNRIGEWGFYDSLYAGGSCFIKDARSLSHQLQGLGVSAQMVDDTYLANKRQLEIFLGRPAKELNFSWINKKVTILGLAFKRDTNDTRNSPSLEVVKFLLEKDIQEVRLYDPSAIEMFKKDFPESDKIKYFNHEFEAMKESDVIIISTDWPQFRGLADMLLTENANKPLIMDGRRILQHRYDDLQNNGFNIIAVGSQLMKAK